MTKSDTSSKVRSSTNAERFAVNRRSLPLKKTAQRPKPITQHLHRRPRLWNPVVVSSDEEEMVDYDSSASLPSFGEEKPPRKTPSRSVHFRIRPDIISIPRHDAYTATEKAKIWNSPSCLKKQARRNRKEWHWECNHSIVEEADFKRNEQGVLVHPAHLVT